jgi:hypothetical protein
MTAYWPLHFPQAFTRGSRQRALANNLVSFDTDYGPPLTAKRGTAAEMPVSGEMPFTHALWEELKQFYEIDCGCGAVNFIKDGKTYRWAAPPGDKDMATQLSVSISWMLQP